MTVIGVLKMIWDKITGKENVSQEVLIAEERIVLWRSIYKGCPAWLDYYYPTLNGRMQKRIRKTMKPAKILCSEIAGLVWSERPELLTAPQVEDVLKSVGFWKAATRETELMLALGATIPKLYVKDGAIGLDWVQADRFIPITSDSTGIHEADIIDRRVVNKKQYVRIEKHRKVEGGYSVTSEVYEDTGGQLVPASLDIFGIKEKVSFSPVKLFFYTGTPEANNLDTDSPLSISIFGNAADTIESLDIAFDALQSELVLGKKRIIVPSGAVRFVTNAETGKQDRYFDPSDEVFQAFAGNDVGDLKIHDNSIELRIEEIRRAIQTLLDILAIQTGLNPGYLSFDGASMKTATEVISDNSKTFKTKQGIENVLGDTILGLCASIRGLLVYTGQSVSASKDSIKWNDSVIEDRNAKTAYIHSRLVGQTMPRYRAIMELDGVDEATARTMAAEITGDNATVDMGGMFGGNDAQ